MSSKVSFHIGKNYSVKHNRRDFDKERWNLDNHIDLNKRHVNLIDRNLRDVVEEVFTDPLEKYNEKVKAKNPGRMKSIDDIYQESRKSAREIIVQVGNMQNNPLENWQHEDMLTAYVQDFKKNNPNMIVFGAYIHLDESTPHLHLDILPVAKDCKRGMSKQISMSGALKEMGFKRTDKYSDRQDIAWLNSRREQAEEFMGQYTDIKPHEKTTTKHMDYWQYKEKKARRYVLDNANENIKQRIAEREREEYAFRNDRDIEHSLHESHGMHR